MVVIKLRGYGEIGITGLLHGPIFGSFPNTSIEKKNKKEKIMPYIKKEDRAFLEDIAKEAVNELKKLPNDELVGNLNYIISKICWELSDPPKYAKFNAIIGALECAKLEMYRRMISPYEDKKILQNGDII